jgi:hypothetical protein
MTSIGHVRSADKRFGATVTTVNDAVRVRVVSVSDVAGTHPVYNLTVAGPHEYFANGVLVSNCDTLRYGMSAKLRYVKPKPRKRKEGYTVTYLKQKRERAKIRAQRASGYGGSYRVG